MICDVCSINQNHFNCHKCLESIKKDRQIKIAHLNERISKLCSAIPVQSPSSAGDTHSSQTLVYLDGMISDMKAQIYSDTCRIAAMKSELTARRKSIAICRQNSLQITVTPVSKLSLPDLSQKAKLLIKTLLFIFKLRRARRKGEVEFRILTVGSPLLQFLPSLAQHQIKKVNAFIGYVTQLTILISRYLNIILPFRLSFAARPSVKMEPSGFRSLVLDDGNSEYFVISLALLNYDIGYLCASQGVFINDIQDTLKNLALLCEAEDLGCDKKIDFDVDIEEVVDLHIQNSQKRWEIVDTSINDTEFISWDFLE